MLMYYKGRILPNEHIQKPDKKIEEWLRVPHTASEYASVLRLGDETAYDTSDCSENFDEQKVLDSRRNQEYLTVFDTDKITDFNDKIQEELQTIEK